MSAALYAFFAHNQKHFIIYKEKRMTVFDFESQAHATLTHLHDTLEEADEKAVLELDMDDDALRIEHAEGKVWIVSKHRMSSQLWLASPLQGGLHFEWDAQISQWVLSSKKSLNTVLEEDFCPLLPELFSLAA